MATSPIYSWPEPDNTDLVKNGALAIRTMGNAIDTTMGTMVAKTIIDAKGDLIAGTANDTAARLAVGANGETLVADSSTATGLRYQGNYAAGKNAIINGDFGVWQRGTTFSITADTYTSDRWVSQVNGNGTRTISRQTFTPGTAPVAGYEGQYFLRMSCTASGTATYYNIKQRIENVQTFAGQTVTVSFWAKASASLTTAFFGFTQTFGSGGSANVDTTGTNLTFTTSYVRYTQTFLIPSISGKTIGASSSLEVAISFGSGTFTSFDIWGFQVEAGSVATAFQTATGTIQGELAACQRYFVALGAGDFYGQYYNSMSQFVLNGRFPVTMRTTPTSTLPSGTVTNAVQQVGVANYNASSFSYFAGGANSFSFTGTATGGTIYAPVAWLASNTTSFSAEL